MPDEIVGAVPTHQATPVPEESPHRRAPGHIARYANHANVASSPFDIRVNFAEIMPDEEGGYFFEDFVSITMSPQHAKALLFLLTKNIKRWEELFGKVDIAKIMMQTTQEAITESDGSQG